ncbi:YopT-type cysteine protease domain-containing protein [Corallococcus exercitus]|uniref:YopT-type cysteine protease domain-containing protein n=1 Tax=Corallococcus exercitus TaxID=2316736 RepID=UPI0035D4B89D
MAGSLLGLDLFGQPAAFPSTPGGMAMNFPEYVVRYSASRTAFKQGDFVGDVERSGFCAALSFSWCRRIMDSQKGSYGVPQELPAVRLAALKKAAPELITNQRVYAAKQTKVRETIPRLMLAMQASLVLSKQGYVAEGDTLYEVSKGVFDDVKKNKLITVGDVKFPRALQELAKDNAVRISGVLKVPPFKDVKAAQTFAKENLERERAHVLGLERFHAIAVYRTEGVFSTDFYFFDPNCGEFHCKGSDNAGFALYALLHTVDSYAHYKELFSFLVTAS